LSINIHNQLICQILMSWSFRSGSQHSKQWTCNWIKTFSIQLSLNWQSVIRLWGDQNHHKNWYHELSLAWTLYYKHHFKILSSWHYFNKYLQFFFQVLLSFTPLPWSCAAVLSPSYRNLLTETVHINKNAQLCYFLVSNLYISTQKQPLVRNH